MEFKLIYTKEVTENPCGVFVENSNVMSWIETASQLGLKSVKFFPVPGNEANSISGAILISSEINEEQSTANANVYNVGGSFYLLSSSQLSPKLSESAIVERFGNTPHFFHPVYGLIELQEIKDWSSFIDLKRKDVSIVQPELGPHFPNRLGEYFIREIEPEEVLKSLMEKSVPDRKSMDSKPLNPLEKLKLWTYGFILGKNKENGKGNSEGEGSSNLASDEIGDAAIPKKKSWWQKKKEGMNTEFENLEERNNKELDKLMDMLKKNPDEALKYALPIDRSVATRGPEVGYTMQNRLKGGSLFGSGFGFGNGNGGGSGGSVNIGESKTDILRRQYLDMAHKYTQDEDWEKASFVYMELLSDPHSAANVLKQGKKYEAAAAIYLSKCKLKMDAAECYEMGRFYGRSIDLYEELERQEKVGDLYTKMGNTPKAKIAYGKELTKLTDSNRYFDAGKISKNKLLDTGLARVYYMKGWERGSRPNDCLDEYLDTYNFNGKRGRINDLHEEKLDGKNAHRFLEVLKLQLDKNADLQNDIEVVAYETIARNSSRDKTIVSLLDSFNKSKLVSKDVMRYKHGRKN